MNPQNNHSNDRRLPRRLRRMNYQAAEHSCHHGEAEPPVEEAAGAHVHPHHPHPHAHEADKAAEHLRDQLQRLQAEFDNYRKRVRREEKQQIQAAGQRIIEQLLPVIDNLDRAIKAPGDAVDSLLNGVEMIRKQLFDVLTQNGLERLESQGQPFDPTQHEAVSVEPSDELPDNTVMDVFQEGYKLGGRLLRPAMVKVSRSA